MLSRLDLTQQVQCNSVVVLCSHSSPSSLVLSFFSKKKMMAVHQIISGIHLVDSLGRPVNPQLGFQIQGMSGRFVILFLLAYLLLRNALGVEFRRRGSKVC